MLSLIHIYWSLVKKKTEADIDKTHKTVGAYIYDTLLGNPRQKIRGRLVRTIERKYYKEELKLILEKQKEFHLELQDRALYAACIDVYKRQILHSAQCAGDARRTIYLYGLCKGRAAVADYYGHCHGAGTSFAVSFLSAL